MIESKNQVFFAEGDTTPLTPSEIATEANAIGCGVIHESAYPFRIKGNLCDCKDGGEFVLFSVNHEACVESGKRYMYCRKCGCSAHL
jgi:hypothetical protein